MNSMHAVILERLKEPMTRRQIAKVIRLDSWHVKHMLDELVDKGLVVKSGGGAGTKYGRAKA